MVQKQTVTFLKEKHKIRLTFDTVTAEILHCFLHAREKRYLEYEKDERRAESTDE